MRCAVEKLVNSLAKAILVSSLALVPLRAQPARPEADVRRDATVEAVERVMPSVVNISTTTIVRVQDPFDDVFRQFFNYGRGPSTRTQAQYSLGSGVVVDEDGYILTNDHVVRRADKIEVTLGSKSYTARIVAQSSATDLALLRIIDPPDDKKFQAVKFARDDDLYLGETVIALGNPFGLGASVSRGILSSKNRRPPVKDSPLDVEDWLQSDAAINPGNSGGPLIDLRGELIGLNVAIYREEAAQGIGFAIPVKRVCEALSEMFTPEDLKGMMFGARIRSNGGLPVVSGVEPGSPASRAGVRAGDLISAVDDRAPRSFIEATELILGHGRGELRLRLRRSGATVEARVRMVPMAGVLAEKLGLVLKPCELTPEVAGRLGLARAAALEVSEVEGDSPADKALLQPGHIILAIDGKPADGLRAAARALSGKQRGEKVALRVMVERKRGPFVEVSQVPLNLSVR